MAAVVVGCLPAEMVWNGVALQLAVVCCAGGVVVGAFTCQVLYLRYVPGATIKAPRAKVLVWNTTSWLYVELHVGSFLPSTRHFACINHVESYDCYDGCSCQSRLRHHQQTSLQVVAIYLAKSLHCDAAARSRGLQRLAPTGSITIIQPRASLSTHALDFGPVDMAQGWWKVWVHRLP